MDIRVYDFNFNLLFIMSDIISSSWSLKYNGVGTYEGHFRLRDDITEVLLENTYLIVTEGENQAVCTGKIADTELLLCGRTLNWLLSKRVMPPFKTSKIFNGQFQTPPAIINYVLDRTFIAPPEIGEDGLYIEGTTDEKKKVDSFRIMPLPEGEVMERHFWRNSANGAEEIISDLCDVLGMGHRLYFNVREKSWDFEVYTGSERSFTLSEKDRNFYDITYTEEIENYASGGWYEAETEENDESVWKYIGFDDGNTAMAAWDAVLPGTGLSEAKSSLSEKKKEYTVSGTVAHLEYGKDYGMGDIVTVSVCFGKLSRTMKYRIEGMNIWYNENGCGKEPILKKCEEDENGIQL